jgi:hypothetical protein
MLSFQGAVSAYRSPGLPRELSVPAALTRPSQWRLAGDLERISHSPLPQEQRSDSTQDQRASCVWKEEPG